MTTDTIAEELKRRTKAMEAMKRADAVCPRHGGPLCLLVLLEQLICPGSKEACESESRRRGSP